MFIPHRPMISKINRYLLPICCMILYNPEIPRLSFKFPCHECLNLRVWSWNPNVSWYSSRFATSTAHTPICLKGSQLGVSFGQQGPNLGPTGVQHGATWPQVGPVWVVKLPLQGLPGSTWAQLQPKVTNWFQVGPLSISKMVAPQLNLHHWTVIHSNRSAAKLSRLRCRRILWLHHVKSFFLRFKSTISCGPRFKRPWLFPWATWLMAGPRHPRVLTASGCTGDRSKDSWNLRSGMLMYRYRMV
jgi:hypothetical protein